MVDCRCSEQRTSLDAGASILVEFRTRSAACGAAIWIPNLARSAMERHGDVGGKKAEASDNDYTRRVMHQQVMSSQNQGLAFCTVSSLVEPLAPLPATPAQNHAN